MRKTYLLVFVHGFKGSDTTFKQYPWDLQKLVQRELPLVDVLSVQYPQFETRGDLWEAIAAFKEWLYNKVSDLEAASHNASPVDDPSVHVVLVGHSMGGIVSAETLLGITRGKLNIPKSSRAASDISTQSQSLPPDESLEPVFFPHVRGILALDTPWLGIAPGVIAFGAENGWNQAANAWMKLTGSGKTATAAETAKQSARSRKKSKGWSMLGKAVAYTGAATAIAGAAGAAYLGWNHLNLGATWVGSHLEFISCLTKGEELKQRLEAVIRLTQTRGIGFAQFYVALGDKMSQQIAQYTGYMVGEERTFVYVPHNTTADICTAAPKSAASPGDSSKAGIQEAHLSDEMEDGDKVEAYAHDPNKPKGRWVKCVNDMAGDELTAHRTMFIAPKNPGYFTFLLPQTRDQIVQWVDRQWYETSEPAPAKEPDMFDFRRSVEMSDRESFDLD